MGGIFISYRREDAAAYAGWLFHTLKSHFGEDQLFRDIDNIAPGDRFPAVIEEAVASCNVMIALIGERWLAVTDDDRRPRLQNPTDYVRRELIAGLRREELLVIPVLLDRAAMPEPDSLPAPLQALAERNALKLESADWDADVARLIKAIERRVLPSLRPTAELAQPLIREPLTPGPGANAAAGRGDGPRWQRMVKSRRALVILAVAAVAGATALWFSFARADSSPQARPPATTTTSTMGIPDTTIQTAPSTSTAPQDQSPVPAPRPAPGRVPTPAPNPLPNPSPATTTTPTSITTTTTTTTLPYGPDTCKSGFVWREAYEGDVVCVTPDTRAQVQEDNDLASDRWVTGAFGPHTCISGYVWRNAFAGDDVCVLPAQRDQAAYDNAQASTRLARA
jgi:hypothetical protein